MFTSLRYSLFCLLVLAALSGYSLAPTITSFSPASGPEGTIVSSNALLATIKLTPASALTNTGTSGTTTAYTTSVPSTTTSVTVTPTTQDVNATVKVNGTTVVSGTASASIPLAVGANTINTIVTAQDGTTTHTYAITVTRAAPSTNALLSTIKLNPASTLTNTGTTGSTTTYATTAAGGTTSVTITPTAQDATATIKVNGVTVASGSASASIALTPGATTTINTVVTAQDGTTTHTYSITVTRLSNNASLSIIKLTPASALTNTGTSGSTTTYTTSVSYATASVTVTPTTQDANATVKVNGITVASGTASGSIPLAVGVNSITTIVTAQDGTTTRTYSITLTRAPIPPNDADLASLAVGSAALSPVFAPGTVSYTANVPNTTTSVAVTAATVDPDVTSITVNGVAVLSGRASGDIALPEGVTTTISIVVTARDGTTIKTYSVGVTRAPSGNATLYMLSLSPHSILTNAGTVGSTTTYTTSVPNTTASVTVTATAVDANAKIMVNGTAVFSGTASGSITLPEGATTTINTVVTAQDGTTTHIYSIMVTRAPSGNGELSNLVISSGTLTPAFDSSHPDYTASVSNATTGITVTPTVSDPNVQALTVNGVAVTSGTASGNIPLAVGSNTINIVITAQDATITTYTITVTRASGPLMSLYVPISVVQPKENVTIENDGVMVHQGVSPNGDGISDVLTIEGITAYPDNKLTIIDRSGAIIFQAKGYNNISKVFNGHSGINGRMQPPGTYFYSLDYVADGQSKHKTGFIILKY